MRVVDTIQGHDLVEYSDGTINVINCKADIDADGSGSSEGDKDFQNDTTLHINGHPINAEKVPYMVVPLGFSVKVKGIVMGCYGEITFRGKVIPVVVADKGPPRKFGEISIEAAKRASIPSSPINGGVSSGVDYKFWPGRPATIDDITYGLQPSKS